MKIFAMNLRSEFLKTKNTSAVWLAIFAGLFVPVLHCVICICRPEVFSSKSDQWLHFITSGWSNSVGFLLPIYIIMLCSLSAQIEYRNSTWKQVFASPRSYFGIYFSKYIVVLSLVVLSLIVFHLGLVAAGYFINSVNSKFKFFDQPPPWALMAKMAIKIFISILAISAIQYWLAIRFRDFIVSFGIGLSCLIGGMIVHSWEYAHYIPYLYPGELIHQTIGVAVKPHDVLIHSMVVFAIVSIMGFTDFALRKEKG